MSPGKKYRGVILLTLCLCMALSLNAEAGNTVGGKRHKVRPAKDADIVITKTFEQTDVDKDGRITAIEFIEHVKVFSFRQLDQNNNNAITLDEWNAVESGPEGQELFARWDQNLDGKLTLQEFKHTPRGKQVLVNIFRTLDANDDGVLRQDEFDIEEAK